MSQRIEDYAVIGDLHTAALVGIDGSIDWLCLPHFDSPSCFARLLGDEDHGFWKIAPAGGPSAILATRRWYRPDTLVVETEYDTATGTVRVTDCMPVREGHPHLVRSVEGVSGTVDMRMELAVRFDYGEVVPWVTSHDGLTRLTAGPDSVALWHRVDAVGKDMRTVADFTVTANQRYPFTLVWYPSHEEPPPPLDSYYAVHLTEAYWTEWATQCCYEGPYKDAVVRSLITLKALTYNPTGGIVAAATTSLPEALGGNRNWDYRYCWLRDATLTLESLDARRLPHRGPGLARLAAARRGRRRLEAPDHVRAGRGAPAGRVGGGLAPRLRGLGSRPDRERRLRPVPARRLRRGHVGPVFVGPGRGRAEPGRLGPAEAAGRVPREGLAGARRRHLGGAGPAPALHPLQGHGLGGRRPGGAHARGVARPRRTARDVAHAAGRHLHRGLRQGLQQGGRRLHPVLRVGPARRQRAHDPPGRLPAADATRGW